MKTTIFHSRRGGVRAGLAAAAIAVSAVLPNAHAGAPAAAAATPVATAESTYRSECSGCHLAYPPALLPAASWQRVMAGLAQHYGSNASLDAPTTRQLTLWLAANAGTGRRAQAAPPEDRITRSAWFVHEHAELQPAVWRRPAVKSPSHCSACHAAAERGSFDEHDVRVPR
ncbi:MAG: diheme cytochrome c [Burkholderiales bacterium]|nr:diheme cytochrome c [Burkholderiales bacterium]MDE2452598.1 diheme cytochrome c [Burkholderiales bacterium]